MRPTGFIEPTTRPCAPRGPADDRPLHLSARSTAMHHYRHRWITPLALILLTLLSIPAARTAVAQERQCFPQTGHCIEGRLLQYWRDNGGLAVFGYPIGPARDERSRDTGAP